MCKILCPRLQFVMLSYVCSKWGARGVTCVVCFRRSNQVLYVLCVLHVVGVSTRSKLRYTWWTWWWWEANVVKTIITLVFVSSCKRYFYALNCCCFACIGIGCYDTWLNKSKHKHGLQQQKEGTTAVHTRCKHHDRIWVFKSMLH
jgi:hypothetical protein